MNKEDLTWVAWMGLNIYSTLPENLLLKAIDAIYKDPEFMKWWEAELKRQNEIYKIRQ